MNRVLLPMLKFSLLTLLPAFLALPLVTIAAETAKAVKPDIEKGAALYAAGDQARNITACIACHGASGRSTLAPNPSLAGQHQAYLAKQLTNFKGPERNNPIMSSIAMGMTDAEIMNVAAYLDAQNPRLGTASDKNLIDQGKKIYRAGIAEKNIPACASCHSPNGAGMPSQYPRLSGQYQDYSTAQLINFRNGGRKNSAAMTTIAKRMTDDDIKAVSDYMAGLR